MLSPSGTYSRSEIELKMDLTALKTPRPSNLFYLADLRRPVVDRAEGIYLWTEDGRRFIDGSSGLEIVNLLDAAGAGQPPTGGANTGFGGTAAHGPGSSLPWIGVIGAGMLLALTGGIWLRRTRLRRLITHV